MSQFVEEKVADDSHPELPMLNADEVLEAPLEQDKAPESERDPSGDVDREPTPMTNSGGHTNNHGANRINQGTQVAEDGSESELKYETEAETTEKTMRVKVVAGSGAPVKTAGGSAPSEEQLFKTRKSGGKKVKKVQGTVDAPNERNDMAPDSLFIGGGPSSADVRQGMIGDCYYQAVLLGIVNGDPGKISDMMSYSGGNVSVDFFRLNSASGEWVEQTVTVNDQLQTWKDKDGAEYWLLQGAGFRVANDATESHWWADVSDRTLKVFRRDVYEVALWSALMEKAYADFAENFGQYGDGFDADHIGMGGYDILDDGGASQRVYNMFYGNAVTEATVQGINAKPGKDLVKTNIPALKRLLALENNKDKPGMGGGDQNFAQIRISTDGAVERCKAFSKAIVKHHYNDINGGHTGAAKRAIGWTKDKRSKAQKELETALQDLITKCDTYLGDDSSDNLSEVAKAADAIQKPGAHPILADASADPRYNHLMENLGIVINLGSDNSPGRRMVYAAHAYNVNAVTLKDSAGKTLNITVDQLEAKASEIDATKSIVVIENPHAGNEPDLDGSGPKDGKNDGRFEMTLDSVFRNFDLLRLATVEHEGEVGDFNVPENNGVGFG